MKSVTEMANEEIYAEKQAVGNEINRLFKENRLQERNALVPRWRELSRAYDWGFSVRETVETIAWANRWQVAVITEHDTCENTFYVRNDKGWEIGVPGSLLRKIGIVEEKVGDQHEQLALF